MDRHYSSAGLERLLSQPVDEVVLAKAVQHLLRCDRCWTALNEVLAGASDLTTHPSGARTALLTLVRQEERSTVAELKADAYWAELKDLGPGEQVQRIKNVASLQNVSLYEVMIADAWNVGPSDPHLGEQIANLALTLAGNLPANRFPPQVRKDLEGEALTAVANCHRLSAHWTECSQAIASAARRLSEGTGDLALKANLLAIQSLLHADTGNFEVASGYSARALEIFREIGDWASFSRMAIGEANALVAAGRAEEAIEKATVVLGLIGPEEFRLELLARYVIIEGHVACSRAHHALHLFARAKPIFERATDTATRLRVRILKALILDGLDFPREAEKLFKMAFQALLDRELYKDAFLILLTQFESECKKGTLGKAEEVCRVALKVARHMKGAVNTQIRAAWEQLLEAVQLGKLGKAELAGARQIFVRYWNVAPKGGPLTLQETSRFSCSEAQPAHIPSPPPLPATMTPTGYLEAREAYDRDLILSALHESGGNISEASRRLGMSRPTVRDRIRKYRLKI